MASEQTLYDKAASTFRSARLLFDHRGDDDAQLNYIGHHLQQALELSIKYQLEQNGVEYPKTHDIDQLARVAREHEIDLCFSEYLEDHAEMFSQWEAKSRYIVGYSIELRKIECALEEVEAYLADIAERKTFEIEALQEEALHEAMSEEPSDDQS
ncbi:MAG: HEPN domain-containing protein [Adlercreutzia sp.]|nr:HEPN domain-containing protein [Adlercreutzia sp.]